MIKTKVQPNNAKTLDLSLSLKPTPVTLRRRCSSKRCSRIVQHNIGQLKMEVPVPVPVNLQLTAEACTKLQEGISLTFSKWWALQMAVENEWGGPHSRDNALSFASRVFDFFNRPNRREPLYIDDLEELLTEGMDSFNTVAEDGSIGQVAHKLMVLHEECLVGNYQSIQKLRELKTTPVPHVRQDENDSDEDEGENLENDGASSMMVDSPASLSNLNPTQVAKNETSPQQMAEAADGWVTVSSKKGRGRRI